MGSGQSWDGMDQLLLPSLNDAHRVAYAAIALAERAHADGQAEDAIHLIDMAYRLFSASLEQRSVYR